MDTKYFFKAKEIESFMSKALSAQKKFREVCGIIVNDLQNNFELIYLKNKSNKPGHFELDLNKIKEIETKMKKRKKKVCGIFHSHPLGEARPSTEDLKITTPYRLLLIYDVCEKDLKLWKIHGAKKKRFAEEIKYEICE